MFFFPVNFNYVKLGLVGFRVDFFPFCSLIDQFDAVA